MKITRVLLLLLVIAGTVAAPGVATARCVDQRAVDACYADCRSAFGSECLRNACYAGCLIGCYLQGESS